MKRLANAAICGLVFALAGACAAQAGEPIATAAPKSLFGTNSTQGPHAPVPYRAEMTAQASDQQTLPSLRASAYGTAQEEKAPAGMRITYKRARDGSFVKTYVAESGTN
ncbi:MAG TPA: hypothetical protein VEH07_04765 [Alphaproteobacteria bacterium]|nr:hypothetical protein [Alphaproteobacteria bacterium]